MHSTGASSNRILNGARKRSPPDITTENTFSIGMDATSRPEKIITQSFLLAGTQQMRTARRRANVCRLKPNGNLLLAAVCMEKNFHGATKRPTKRALISEAAD